MQKRGVLLVLLIGIAIGFFLAKIMISNDCDWPCLSCSVIVNASHDFARPVLDRAYLDTAVTMINNATKFVHIAVYEFRIYNTTMPIANALIKAKQRGVDVKILLDASTWNTKTTSKNKKTIEFFKQHGIEAKYDSLTKTMHAKFIVVDNATVLVGSTNIVYYGLTQNHEANIMLKNEEIAKQFENYFQFLWTRK